MGVTKKSALIASTRHLKETSMMISVSPSYSATEAASYRPSGEAIIASRNAFSFRLFSRRSLASSSASNLASAFFLRSSDPSVVSTLVPQSASTVHGPGPRPFPYFELWLFCWGWRFVTNWIASRAIVILADFSSCRTLFHVGVLMCIPIICHG